MLDEPTRATRVGFVEGFGAALLTALVVPVVTGLTSDTSNLATLVPVAGPVLAGLLLAPTLGLGLFRDALGRRVAGLPSSPLWPVCLGVAAGAPLGQTASLATVGDQNLGEVEHPALMLIGTVGYLGGTMVAAGIGSLCALASARLTRWLVVGCALVLVGIGYGATAALVEPLVVAWDNFGWPLARVALAAGLGSNAAAIVAMLAAVILSRSCSWQVPSVGATGLGDGGPHRTIESWSPLPRDFPGAGAFRWPSRLPWARRRR